jgi:hypothetical protein
VGLNLFFFCVVVGLDLVFGNAPQFTVPLFVPVLVFVVAFTFLMARKSQQMRTEPISDFNTAPGMVNNRVHQTRMRTASAFHSALVIRRQPTTNINSRERRQYETSI